MITTPNYPGFYYKDLQCTYIIQVEKGHRISINFEDFDLPKNKTADGTCLLEEDYLDVELGLKVFRRYCTERPTMLVSTNNYMKLIFHSGKFTSRGRGFRVKYLARSGYCGGVLSEPRGTAETSTQFNLCEWIIQGKERNYIRLSLLNFAGDGFINIFSNDSFRGDRLLNT